MSLWHHREVVLAAGAVIQSGRFGSIVLAQGGAHPHYFRELYLEVWRLSQTQVAVSRLACSYAFEEYDDAEFLAAGGPVYEVEPVDQHAATVRVDTLWLTWLAEPGATIDRATAQCKKYWDGLPTTAVAQHVRRPQWEHLFACDLRVVSPGPVSR